MSDEKNPTLHFFGNTVPIGSTTSFAGHCFYDGNPVAAALIRLPADFWDVAERHPGGRPRSTIADLTLLAHVWLAQQLHPAPGRRGWRGEATAAALQLLGRVAERRTVDAQLRRARKLVSGLHPFTLIFPLQQTGYWFALTQPLRVENGVESADCDGWLCRAGELACWGRVEISLSAGGRSRLKFAAAK